MIGLIKTIGGALSQALSFFNRWWSDRQAVKAAASEQLEKENERLRKIMDNERDHDPDSFSFDELREPEDTGHEE